MSVLSRKSMGSLFYLKTKEKKRKKKNNKQKQKFVKKVNYLISLE